MHAGHKSPLTTRSSSPNSPSDSPPPRRAQAVPSPTRPLACFDTAWIYSNGQPEERVGIVAQHRRQETWIATKASDRSRDGALEQLEESLSRLQTDHVDEWRLHHVWSIDELDKCFAADGAIHAMVQAREQGMVRYASMSGHTNPQVQIEALRRFPFDSVLMPASVLDHFIYSFAEEFLPVANAKGVATVAMKVFGLGKLAHIDEKALRYTLGLLVSAIAACSGVDELKREPQVARRFVPLSGVDALHCSARYCRCSSRRTFHGRQMIGRTPKLGICARRPHRFRLP